MKQADQRNLTMVMDLYELTMANGYFNDGDRTARVAFDVFYNRATTFGRACYYHDSRELRAWIDLLPLDGTEMRKLAERHYRWENIVRQYEGLYLDFLPKAVTSP